MRSDCQAGWLSRHCQSSWEGSAAHGTRGLDYRVFAVDDNVSLISFEKKTKALTLMSPNGDLALCVFWAVRRP